MTRSLFHQILSPRCPKCGEGRLFKNTLDIVDHCASCSLTLKHHDAADGPAFFAITLVSFLVVGLAVFVELHYEPPFWVHGVLWIPLVLITSLMSLRMFKTILVTYEFKTGLLKQDPTE